MIAAPLVSARTRITKHGSTISPFRKSQKNELLLNTSDELDAALDTGFAKAWDFGRRRIWWLFCKGIKFA
jgi:hypothetical protein